LIGLWSKLLEIPYKYLCPAAIFFICVGVYSTNNSVFDLAEALAIGLFGYWLHALGFHPAPVLLGFVLGPRVEENFRRAMLLSRGSFAVFLERPVSAFFIALCCVLIVAQLYFRRKPGLVAIGGEGALEVSPPVR
jgi:TctA family transporter